LVRFARGNLSLLSSADGQVVVVLEALATAVVAMVCSGKADSDFVDDAEEEEEEDDDEDELEVGLFHFVDTFISK
jgi:hypothetical protein